MTRDAALSTVLARATDQLENGIRALAEGHAPEAEVWIRAARASLAILAAGAPDRRPPLSAIEDGNDLLPEWFHNTHGGEK